eukprot:gnl/Chilomastix_caulleri/2657.p1 GENE.gnl/Chilomastix_caulleri/2657~~gnl/Chilomastix_caulleri/2657.p1  ORF type:complete len:135 (+),score=13.52 gnl/Chilomastix_caulleri/2657:14-418(+)
MRLLTLLRLASGYYLASNEGILLLLIRHVSEMVVKYDSTTSSFINQILSDVMAGNFNPVIENKEKLEEECKKILNRYRLDKYDSDTSIFKHPGELTAGKMGNQYLSLSGRPNPYVYKSGFLAGKALEEEISSLG